MMNDQANGFGCVRNPERQPDFERIAWTQLIRQPVQWLCTLLKCSGAGWVALPRLIFKFDPRVSRALTNPFCVAGDFHTSDPRVVVGTRRTGQLRREFSGATLSAATHQSSKHSRWPEANERRGMVNPTTRRTTAYPMRNKPRERIIRPAAAQRWRRRAMAMRSRRTNTKRTQARKKRSVTCMVYSRDGYTL